MKTLLLLLAALVAAAGPAQALHCHVCSSTTNCKKPQSCPANWRYCRTTSTVEPLSGNLVEKDCAESCVPSYNLPGQISRGITTLCCQSDLCNEKLHSGAPARALLSGTAAGLALALSLLTLGLAPRL
ncbi:lymphocyte antigen 6D-like [Molossus molossus]|uniref:Lymphocyte antigen 6 family member D n=1 Tax=Molossus molossus TaxID=27622 RepID=A0A7J8BBH3_MOLMO|nr:lymphocyte antigen 6D-like [Molossus molossus]KAF6395839.1 lymphocyte antigen 6 family member D [Molossus molossus]